MAVGNGTNNFAPIEERRNDQFNEEQSSSCTWIETIASPIILLDSEKGVMGFNTHASSATSIECQEIMRQPLQKFLQPESADSFNGAVQDIENGLRQDICLPLSFCANPKGGQYHVKVAARLDPTDRSYCGFIIFFVEPTITNNDPPFFSSLLPPLPSAERSTPSDGHLSSFHDSMTSKLGFEIDALYLPVFGLDRSACIFSWNSTMELLTGFMKADVTGKNFAQEFVTPDMQPRIEEIIANALEGKGTFNFDFDIQLKNNGAFKLVMNATARRNEKNKITGVIFVAEDTTEVQKGQDEMIAIAKELRKVIATANAPIFGVDCDGNINEWNRKSVEISGFERDQVAGCSLVNTTVVPSMRHEVEQVLQDALRGFGISSYKVDFITSRKEIRHLLVNASARRDADNNIIGVVCVAQDVTETVHRERAVAGMVTELRQLIDTANAPIFGIDVEGDINEWNRRAAEITGYSMEEAFDVPLVERFIATEMKEKAEEILVNALQGHETSDYDLKFISKIGETISSLVNATTRRDPENAIVGDVTEDRKNARILQLMENLRASQEAKAETERNVAAYFAHELRNPLGAIDSALHAMPSNLPEEAKSLVSGMQLCTGFMSSTMNNLLDIRKLEEGKIVLINAPISLKKVVGSVHKMLLPSVRPGVKFTKKIETQGRDWIIGDSHRVQQVITNVVANAIKYTVNGSICLSVGWEGDMVKFECKDTGPGIPKKQQGKLFQRSFQRGDAPGTGLGLAIAKYLVDLNGGSIQFHSDPTVKAGTTCEIYMTLQVCNEPRSVVEETPGVIEEPLAFLIIDDIKINRTMLRRRITKGIAPNAVIEEAATGEAALKIVGDRAFDVIIVDQYMEEAGGVMVGTDAVFAMRRMRIDAVIIGCSGNDMGTQFTEAGSDFVWQKPIPTNEQIIQDIRKSLNEKRPGVLRSPKMM